MMVSPSSEGVELAFGNGIPPVTEITAVDAHFPAIPAVSGSCIDHGEAIGKGGVAAGLKVLR